MSSSCASIAVMVMKLDQPPWVPLRSSLLCSQSLPSFRSIFEPCWGSADLTPPAHHQERLVMVTMQLIPAENLTHSAARNIYFSKYS